MSVLTLHRMLDPKNPVRATARRLRLFLSSLQFASRTITDRDGILRSSRLLSRGAKRKLELRYAMEERAQIALAVASMYPGGDYFEFGSAGFRTLRNFLTAFDLNDRPTQSPDTKFFAFDVFGDVDSGQGVPDGEEWYYRDYRGVSSHDRIIVENH